MIKGAKGDERNHESGGAKNSENELTPASHDDIQKAAVY